MSGIIDANILLYAANSDAQEHDAASEFVIRAANSAQHWYFTEGILYEFLRVATHPKVFPRPLVWNEGLAFLQRLLESPRFQVLGVGDRHWTLLREVLQELTRPSGNLFFDVRTVVIMKEHGIREIYTTDTDFLQFSGIQTINPLKS